LPFIRYQTKYRHEEKPIYYTATATDRSIGVFDQEKHGYATVLP